MSVVPLPPGHSAGPVTPRASKKSGDPHGKGEAKSGAPSRLLTFQDVAAHCAVSVWTVRAWVDTGKLEVVRLPGRLVRIRPETLSAFLERC
jgi:excisionase family DNA binding protein